MRGFGPRALTPHDGWSWLVLAWQLLWRRPWLFVAVALFAPGGSALLLALPVWEWWLPPLGGWVTLLATILCYGLPLSLTVTLACGVARATNRKRAPASKLLFNRTAIKALLRTSLFLFLLLLQGYLVAYWVQDQLLPVDLAVIEGQAPPPVSFGVATTLLGTQLSVLGSMVMILQILLAGFVVPLQLFRELPLSVCWRRSALAMQLNPWLFPALGLLGLLLIAMPFLAPFSILAQVLALPLPVYWGALMYVAWSDVFQSGAEERELEELRVPWRASIGSGSVSHRVDVQPDSAVRRSESPARRSAAAARSKTSV